MNKLLITLALTICIGYGCLAAPQRTLELKEPFTLRYDVVEHMGTRQTARSIVSAALVYRRSIRDRVVAWTRRRRWSRAMG